MPNIGQAVGNFLGFDPTPGFNLRNPTSNSDSWGGGAVGPTGGGKGPASFVNAPLSMSGKPPAKHQTSGGQTKASSTTKPATDPYAKYGGQDSYNRLVSGFDTQKSNIFGSSKESAQNAAIGRKSSILDFITQMQQGQRGVDERGIQNELAKKQGTSSILDMVGRGIRSGGTMLAGKNASDSSAAEGIARAYGDIGQRKLSGIGNQYELENRNIGIEQSDLETQQRAGLRKFDEGKTQMVNNIVSDARNRLAELDAAMVEADVPGRVAIEQEKNRIKQEAIGILSQFDQMLSQGVEKIDPMDLGGRQRTAADLATRGVAAENPFDFTATGPAQFQGTGPFPSELPLFSLNRSREQEV